MSKVISNNIIRDATAEEQAEIDARNTAWNNNSANRKLGWIKEIRLQDLRKNFSRINIFNKFLIWITMF